MNDSSNAVPDQVRVRVRPGARTTWKSNETSAATARTSERASSCCSVTGLLAFDDTKR